MPLNDLNISSGSDCEILKICCRIFYFHMHSGNMMLYDRVYV